MISLESICDRWQEANAKPNMLRWKSLSDLFTYMADFYNRPMPENEKNKELEVDEMKLLEGITYERMQELCPKRRRDD